MEPEFNLIIWVCEVCEICFSADVFNARLPVKSKAFLVKTKGITIVTIDRGKVGKEFI